jgi:serine/threonine protein kinase
MPLTAGDNLGPYEILASIGKGGMGEVYRARDSRVGRDVAIKISAERFSERSEREARAIAALNHPNICTLYDVGPNYLVLEYIEGEAPKGPLRLEEVLCIARQVADALEAASEAARLAILRNLRFNLSALVGPDAEVVLWDCEAIEQRRRDRPEVTE